MASQVLSGSGDVTYTNNTGQNVRIVINFLQVTNGTNQQGAFSISWGGGGSTACSITRSVSIGRNIAGSTSISDGGISSQNLGSLGSGVLMDGCPTELVIGPTATFAIDSNSEFIRIAGYNIVVIPEAG